MERAEYWKMHALEERLWWYRGLHANLITAIHLARPARGDLPWLDAGCGTGGTLRALKAAFPQRMLIGLDLDLEAATLAGAKTVVPVLVGSVGALPVSDGTLGAIVCGDVLSDAHVDEGEALFEFHRCLASGGILVMNLPAYRRIASAHDRAVHVARRYTASQVRILLKNAGFRIISLSYWNSILFPLMAVRRKLLARNAVSSDVAMMPVPFEMLFRVVMRFENLLLRGGFALPFGGSVLAVAVR